MAIRKPNGKEKHLNGDSELYKRRHRQSFMLNELEYKALAKYCRKYGIKNKAKFLRETIISTVLKKFEDDYPTLFDNEELK